MSLVPPASVPREYLGRARLLRQKLERADDAIVRQHSILGRRFAARQARGKITLRPSMIRDVEAEINAAIAAQFGQRLPCIVTATKKHTRFSTLRLITHSAQGADWEGDLDTNWEDGVELVALFLCADREGIHQIIRPLATWNLHALGRFYQRSFKNSETDLLDALWAVVPQFKEAMDAEDEDFGLATPAGGRWFGHKTDITNGSGTFVALDVRTYFDHIEETQEQAAPELLLVS